MTSWDELVVSVKRSVGIEDPARGSVLSEAPELLPKQRMDGRLLTPSKQVRCTLQEKEFMNHGRYGLIQVCKREPGSERLVIKRPKRPSFSQITEALVQQVAYEILRRRGIFGAIPRVSDLYVFAAEERFTMECVDGQSLSTYLDQQARIMNSVEFSKHFMDLLVQLCVVLYVLETDMRLDHRDLSPANVWVRTSREPFRYTIDLDGQPFVLESTVQLVVLDFGFCCLGLGPATEAVTLGGVIPPLDPCPKEGRDILTLLNRLYTIPSVRRALSLETVALLRSWCHPYTLGEEPYRTLLDTSEPGFQLTALHTATILRWYRVAVGLL